MFDGKIYMIIHWFIYSVLAEVSNSESSEKTLELDNQQPHGTANINP